MTAFHAFAAVVLVAILVRQWLKLHRAGLDRATGRHASREAIRQVMDLHPHERGEMPTEDTKVDNVLALRIAQGLSRGLWTRRKAATSAASVDLGR